MTFNEIQTEARVLFIDGMTGNKDGIRRTVNKMLELGIGFGLEDAKLEERTPGVPLTRYVLPDLTAPGALGIVQKDALKEALACIFEKGPFSYNALVNEILAMGIEYGRNVAFPNRIPLQLLRKEKKGEYAEQHMVFVKRLVIDQLDADPARLEPDSHIIDDLGADSLDIVELIMLVEEEYGIEIPDDEAEKIGTLRDIAVYLTDKKVPERKRRRPKD